MDYATEQLRQWYADNSEFFVLSAIAMKLRIPNALFVGWVLGDPKTLSSDIMEDVEQWAKEHGYGYGYGDGPILVEHTLRKEVVDSPEVMEDVKIRMGELVGRELVKRGAIKFETPKLQYDPKSFDPYPKYIFRGVLNPPKI
jgi:hypothetical protein